MKRIMWKTFERDEETELVSISAEYPARDGIKSTTIPLTIVDNVREFKKYMIGRGLVGEFDFVKLRNELLGNTYLSTTTITRRPGWRGKIFVNRFGVFNQERDSNERYKFNTKAVGYVKPRRKGNVKKYLKALDEAFAISPILLFVFGASLVPALSMRLEQPQSFSVALTGPSTGGKTLAIRVAQSISGRAEKEDLTPFNLTAGVAGSLGAFSGSAIAFGDPKGAQGKGKLFGETLQTVIFSVSEGSARMRLDVENTLAPVACIPLMSFEQPLEVIFARCDIPFEEGECVRVIELVVPHGDLGGIFEMAEERKYQLVEQVDRTISDNYGTMLAAWVKLLANNEDLGGLINKYIEEFDSLVMARRPLEKRLLLNFSWVYASLKFLVTQSPLLPRTAICLDEHFRILGAKALQIFDNGNPDVAAGLKKVLRYLVQTKFPTVQIGCAACVEEAGNGFIRKDRGGHRLYARKEFIDALIDPELRPAIFRSMKELGILKSNRDELTWHVEQAGLGRSRYLKFDLSASQNVLEDE